MQDILTISNYIITIGTAIIMILLIVVVFLIVNILLKINFIVKDIKEKYFLAMNLFLKPMIFFEKILDRFKK